MLSKPLAVAFWLSAAAVGLHFMLTPFYDHAVDIGQIWDILNWVMAAGVVIALVVNYLRKRQLDSRGGDGAVTREYLETNVVVYALVALTLWFFWNWFDSLTSADDVQSSVNLSMWAFVDPLFVVIAGVTGCHLWRCSDR